jgi:Fe-S-cluster containining protein
LNPEGDRIQFECTKCGACCREDSLLVTVTGRDIPPINTEQGLAYIALKKLENGDCVFLKDNLCMIHSIRPAVCMSFPFVFWGNDDEKTWGLSAMKEICPGLGCGPVVEILDLKELAVAVLEDLTLYKEFAEEWNRDEETPTAKRVIETILSDNRFTA